jgi:hypothetical protein
VDKPVEMWTNYCSTVDASSHFWRIKPGIFPSSCGRVSGKGVTYPQPGEKAAIHPHTAAR